MHPPHVRDAVTGFLQLHRRNLVIGETEQLEIGQ